MGEQVQRTKDDQAGTHESGHGSTPNRLEGQVHEGSQGDTADGGEEAHGDVGDIGLDVVLANLLEVEAAVEAGQPAGEGDEHLGEGRVDVHEELALDIFRREATEAEGLLSALHISW